MDSRDININTGSANHSVILQVIKSLPEKYETKVIVCRATDGDLKWSRAKVVVKIRFSTVSSHIP